LRCTARGTRQDRHHGPGDWSTVGELLGLTMSMRYACFGNLAENQRSSGELKARARDMQNIVIRSLSDRLVEG
jgi:hypothetical protein